MNQKSKPLMRVLLIASGDLYAGAEVVIYQLVSNLIQIATIQLLVVLMNKGRLASELERMGVVTYIIDESVSSFVSSYVTIRRLVKDFAPDVIHSHRYKENFFAWCSSRCLPGCSLVATQHGMPESVGNLSRTGRLRNALFFRLLSFGFTKTVVVSEDMRRSLIGRYGFSEKNVTVIHNGIHVPDLAIAPPIDRMVVGSAGRLFPVKDFFLLVEVAREVVLHNDNVDFVLAGDGPDLAKLKQLVGRYGLEGRFKFLGYQENMTAFYERLHVYINTSLHEGIPMSVLEAMSHGLPVVAPKVGGFPEIVEHGACGFLVDNRDAKMFAQHILRLLDPRERGEMGRAARARTIDFFSKDAMAQRYCQLYDELTCR